MSYARATTAKRMATEEIEFSCRLASAPSLSNLETVHKQPSVKLRGIVLFSKFNTMKGPNYKSDINIKGVRTFSKTSFRLRRPLALGQQYNEEESRQKSEISPAPDMAGMIMFEIRK